MDREKVIGEDAIFESMNKCARGVRWKGSVAYWAHHWPDEVGKLSSQLRDGTYTERKARFFTITEPKTREIMSIHFRDRVYQRSLNDVAIYPQASRSYIHDNFACQKGKGTQAARERLTDFLKRYYRKNKADGYVLKIDIKGYYPNIDHGFAERMITEYIDEDTNQMAKAVLAHLPGEVGYNPGSQIVQIVGITALDKIDHYIKERLRVKFYIRYMDDFLLIHREKEYIERCLSEITELLKGQGMAVNMQKTTIRRIAEPINFLGFDYRLTKTGKVIILASPAKVKHERKKIVRMVSLVRDGKLTRKDVDEHFRSYKSSVRYGNSHGLIHRLNEWYDGLWEGEKHVQHYQKT